MADCNKLGYLRSKSHKLWHINVLRGQEIATEKDNVQIRKFTALGIQPSVNLRHWERKG